MALTEPCVLNVALAVAASHHSRWQRIPDTMSRKYLRAACKAVRDRFTDPRLIKSPATLAAMLLLVSYEVNHFRNLSNGCQLTLLYRYFQDQAAGKATTLLFAHGFRAEETVPISIPFSRTGFVLLIHRTP